jgi:hypothetical protein
LITDLECGAEYIFAIEAVNVIGESIKSVKETSVISAGVPNPPLAPQKKASSI